MQETKNKRRFILLIVLLSAIVLTYWLGNREGKGDIDRGMFRPADLASIDEVQLQSESGDLKLTYSNNRWTLNDKYPADARMIEVLFATIQQVEPKRPLPASQKDSVTSLLRKQGIKVTLLSGGTVQKTFYAGGNASKTQAVFMEGAEGTPYIATIPGYRVYVAGVFELDESGWRNKRIFAFNWRNFQELKTQYPGSPSDGFNIALKGQLFTVSGLTQVDTTRLNNYLDDISLLDADGYLAQNERLDSLAKTAPLMNVTVGDVGGRQYSLSVFPPADGASIYPGLVNQTQWATFQKENLDRILLPRNFFGR